MPGPVPALDYATPRQPRNYARMLLVTIGTVFVCSVVFGLGGAALGLIMGLVSPGYYRTVFQNSDPNFSPAAVGFGLGLAEGAAIGVPAGLVLVFILVWREVRLAQATGSAR